MKIRMNYKFLYTKSIRKIITASCNFPFFLTINKIMEAVSVYQYDDCRQYFKDYFEERKKNDQVFICQNKFIKTAGDFRRLPCFVPDLVIAIAPILY